MTDFSYTLLVDPSHLNASELVNSSICYCKYDRKYNL